MLKNLMANQKKISVVELLCRYRHIPNILMIIGKMS